MLFDPRAGDPMEAIRQTCVNAALAAGDILRNLFGRPQRINGSSRHDLKLEADLLSEAVICETIESRFPGSTIISEETTISGRDSGYTWIVDPLDGTVNFCHSIPMFGVSIACYRKGQAGSGETKTAKGAGPFGVPVIGIVYHPVMNELFVGVPGRGATLNGLPLEPANPLDLKDAVVSLSFGSREPVMRRMERLNATLLRHVRKVRVFGATSIDLVNIASGRLSGLVQGCVREWDFAAGRVILEESGGRFCAREVDKKGWAIVAAHADIFESLEQMARQTEVE